MAGLPFLLIVISLETFGFIAYSYFSREEPTAFEEKSHEIIFKKQDSINEEFLRLINMVREDFSQRDSGYESKIKTMEDRIQKLETFGGVLTNEIIIKQEKPLYVKLVQPKVKPVPLAPEHKKLLEKTAKQVKALSK